MKAHPTEHKDRNDLSLGTWSSFPGVFWGGRIATVTRVHQEKKVLSASNQMGCHVLALWLASTLAAPFSKASGVEPIQWELI